MEYEFYSAQDAGNIRRLFSDVFSQSGGAAEGRIVGNLAHDLITGTNARDLAGFVAREQGQIVGCILFSRLVFDVDVGAFLLSPVAIDSGWQGKGIGQQLINFGIDQLRKAGVDLVITYGDPAFYSKVGFSQLSEAVVEAPFKLSQPEGWLGQSLLTENIEPIRGRPVCVDAFNNPEIW